MRVLRVADYDRIEAAVRERVKKQLLPEAKVELLFERRRPPLEASPASVAMAKHAQGIYKELGMDLVVDAVAEGGGTDAAFAALQTKNAVVERFGLRGFGAHSNDDEYILISSIEPRLYLAARLVMDLAARQGALNMEEENKLIEERREKLKALRAQGIAFPNDFRRKDLAADLHEKYGAKTKEELEPLKIEATVAGRMVLKRVMGKASFATLQDQSGRIQLYVSTM